MLYDKETDFGRLLNLTDLLTKGKNQPFNINFRKKSIEIIFILKGVGVGYFRNKIRKIPFVVIE